MNFESLNIKFHQRAQFYFGLNYYYFIYKLDIYYYKTEIYDTNYISYIEYIYSNNIQKYITNDIIVITKNNIQFNYENEKLKYKNIFNPLTEILIKTLFYNKIILLNNGISKYIAIIKKSFNIYYKQILNNKPSYINSYYIYNFKLNSVFN